MLTLSVKNVLKRAKREGWHSRIRKGQGGGHEWLLTSMPEVTRVAVAAKVCASAALPAEGITSPSAGTAAPVAVPADERRRAPGRSGAAASLAALTGAAIVPAKTIYEMEDQVAAQLAASGRPLIVDECDHLVAKSSIEIVRDIYEASGAAILLIGEEHLPAGLARWERIHNRVLEWVPAQYATMTDARALRDLYCDRVAVEDDLLAKIHEVSKGVARRICVNLERAQQAALGLGKKSMSLAEWGKRSFYTGEAPVRGRV